MVLGFDLDKILPPDYQYSYSFHKREHKFKYDKRNIEKKFLGIYSSVKTEWQMMQEAGFDRIWDCGKLRYVLGNVFNPPKQSKPNMVFEPDYDLIAYMEKISNTTDGRLLDDDEIEKRLNYYEQNRYKVLTEQDMYEEKTDQNNQSVNKDFNVQTIKEIKTKKSYYSHDVVYKVCADYIFKNKSIRGIAKEMDISPNAVKTILTKSGVNLLKNKRKYVGGKRAVDKRYQEKNKKKKSEYYKEYRKKNKEKLKDYHKDWYEENKERLIEKRKAEYASKKYGDS